MRSGRSAWICAEVSTSLRWWRGRVRCSGGVGMSGPRWPGAALHRGSGAMSAPGTGRASCVLLLQLLIQFGNAGQPAPAEDAIQPLHQIVVHPPALVEGELA